MTILFLWSNRERPDIFTTRWFKVWAKRILQTYPLARICLTGSILKLKGAKIGALTILNGTKLNGKLKNLRVSKHVSLGRCEIFLHNKVSIGKCVVINDGAIILTGTHDLKDTKWGLKTAAVVIGDYAWIATNAIILPGVKIGRGAVIGAGAVVRADVPDYAVAIGNPSVLTTLERVKNLDYLPILLNAPYEAWIGKDAISLGDCEEIS